MSNQHAVTRRSVLAGLSIAGVAAALPACRSRETVDLSRLVRMTDQGVLFDYEIIPVDPKERRENKFKNYGFRRPGQGETIFSPVLDDERWFQHYRNLRALFQFPIAELAVKDVDPLFGMFAYRVHPTTLVPRYHHTAIDVFREPGSEITAAFEGTADVRFDDKGGNWVLLKHPVTTNDGYHLETRYLHLREVAEGIRDGAHVEKGQPIGFLGGTGIMQDYFPHLHFEVVMENPTGPGKPIVLDPMLVYFDIQRPEGFFDNLFFDPQTAYRSLTGSINSNDPKVLAELLNGLSAHEKRFLPLYKQYWEYESERGSEKHQQLLSALD